MPLALQTYPTVAEAGLALQVPGSRYLGGGTLAVRAANEGDLSFSFHVRTTDPALSTIDLSDGRARIGASVTMAAIERHPGLSALGRAARTIGGPAVRNMATVGGNLFARPPYGDFAVALLALGATVELGTGETLPMEDFLAAREKAKDIVTAVHVALPAPERFRFVKITRVKPRGIPVLSIAALIEEEGGVIQSAGIALGCMAARPIRARGAEQALVGNTRSEVGIADAVRAVGENIEPITDAVASAWYRREVLPVHFARLLLA